MKIAANKAKEESAAREAAKQVAASEEAAKRAANTASIAATDQKRKAELEAVAQLKARLKDPMSAQIRVTKIELNRQFHAGSGDLVCGFVNAKNSYGGYIGERGFFSAFGVASVMNEEDMDCQKGSDGRVQCSTRRGGEWYQLCEAT